MGLPKKINLSDLFKIEIRIIKRKESYHERWYAISNFLLELKSPSFEKRFLFIHSSSALRQTFRENTKQIAINKRSEFEIKLKELEFLFPNLISFQNDAPPSKEIGRGFCCYFICLTFIMVSCITASLTQEDPFVFIPFSVVVTILWIFAVIKYNRAKIKQDKSSNKVLNSKF